MNTVTELWLFAVSVAAAGALSGVVLAGAIPISYLFLLFGAILLLSAHQMLAKRRNPTPASASASSGPFSWRLDSSYPDHELGDEIAYRVARLPIGMILMYCAGLSSALFGYWQWGSEGAGQGLSATPTN